MTGSRVVVVGAGHNGLVCALRLAEAGFQVTVVEAAERPGGAVRSSEDTLPGFVHDVCSGFFPLTAASPPFRELGLEGIEWISPKRAMAHPFADGRAICLHRDLAETAASLDAASNGAGDAWRAVVAPLLRNAGLVARSGLAPLPPVRAAAALALRLGRDGVE